MVLVGLMLGACTGGGPAGSEDLERALATQGPGVCSGQDEVASLERAGGKLSGDLDGDREADVVYIVSDPGAEPGCRSILVVETHRGVMLSHPLDTGDVEPIGGLPAVSSLAAIDERPGAEIVVDVLAGASTTFAAVYSAGGDRLERMSLPEGSPYGDLFPYGGSVGHMESSACGDDGTVVVGSVVPQGARYLVTETIYRPRDGKFAAEEVVTETIDNLEGLEGRFGSFAEGVFGNCPAAG